MAVYLDNSGLNNKESQTEGFWWFEVSSRSETRPRSGIMSLIPALSRLRQEDHEFKHRQVYIVRLGLKKEGTGNSLVLSTYPSRS
jgi:hypothetical protein